MPAKHTLHVALTEPLIRYVRDKVEAGHHATFSDVVRAGLQTMIEREQPEQRERYAHVRSRRLTRG